MSLIALVGNPNVGKSTLFNGLTGLKQHTGNWPGKTVELAAGQYTYKGKKYDLVDLPGTYSLDGSSREEEITGEFVRVGTADGLLVVCDGTCLERSLILALQVISTGARVLVAVNLIDEAKKMGITVDTEALATGLGVPVVAVCGKDRGGLEQLQEQLRLLAEGYLPSAPPRREGEGWEIAYGEELCRRVCRRERSGPTLTEKLDRILLHPIWAYPCLFILLLIVFWLTIEGANYPSQGLQWIFSGLGRGGRRLLGEAPPWVSSLIMDGLYEPVTRVMSVMLPPMAIFFPLFTLLEDFGYLPRIAYLLDEGLHRCGGCGKQALTMSMGLGCNAVGVTGCRIIDSPRERLIGILTNALMPCNGRFPALILLLGVCFPGLSPGLRAVGLTGLVVLAVGVTMVVSRLLHKTMGKKSQSVFVMELPPYRVPRIGQVVIRAFLDRCLTVLGRAVAVAAPMGVLIWAFGELRVGEGSLLQYLSSLLEKPGALLGIGGTMLLAFLLGSPANELVLPLFLMILTGNSWGEGQWDMERKMLEAGVTDSQALCTMVFMLFHWPCTTTLWTVYKESRSVYWTALAWAIPTGAGSLLCILIHWILRL